MRNVNQFWRAALSIKTFCSIQAIYFQDTPGRKPNYSAERLRVKSAGRADRREEPSTATQGTSRSSHPLFEKKRKGEP